MARVSRKKAEAIARGDTDVVIAADTIVVCDGKILAIIVPGPCGIFGFGKTGDLVIAWNKIQCIGEDAILVRLQPGECCFPESKKGKMKRFF